MGKRTTTWPDMSTRTVDILDSLPHRPPFLFITDGIDVSNGKTGTANWRVRGDEDFFAGHFPSSPIVPGVLIGEALAQLCGLVELARDANDRQSTEGQENGPSPGFGKLAHIDLRLNHTVTPPATIQLACTFERAFGALVQFSITARVDYKRVARGSLTLSIPDAGAKESVDGQ